MFLDALDLLALHKLIDDPFETLAAALYHVDDEHALEIPLILGNIVSELFVPSANSANKLFVGEFTGDSLRPNQIQVRFDPNDGDVDLELLDAVSYGFIDLIVGTGLKSDWGVFEEFVTLLIELLLV